ncbi:MAG TPA: hypothetical protein VM056_07145 [Terriglobales bacterium]|nr:hypothetical protein [Terriglobales bacterium]
MSANPSTNQSADRVLSTSGIPNRFSPDWHHQLGESLAAFPRYLTLPLEGELTQFWPDLATFTEGPCWSVMMYYPGTSRYSICVLHWKDIQQWEITKFDDEHVVAKTMGESYAEAMAASAQLN